MIKSITIQNFQSHKDTTLQFDKGVNAIIGNSDSGKTAIIRALNWVVNNKPMGDSFRSNWGGTTSVEVKFDDGVVERVKDSSLNYYSFRKIVHKAMKSDVPPDIEEFINMNEINLQMQLDAPFLLSSSSGDVAKLLNKIANLSNIDSSISNIKKRVLATNREISSLKDQIAELEESKTQFANLNSIEVKVQRLASLETKYDTADKMSTGVTTLLTKIQKTQDTIDGIKDVSKPLKKLAAIESLATELEALETKTNALETLLQDKILMASHDVEHYTNEFARLSTAFQAAMPNECPLCGKE